MKLKIILFSLLHQICLFSQNNALKKIYESKVGVYYSTTDNKDIIFSLDSFLVEKSEKAFANFKHELHKPVKFEFYQNEKEVLCYCGLDTTKLNLIYERLACVKGDKIQITGSNSSAYTDSLYNKWGGFHKTIFHRYIHVLLNDIVKGELPKCFSEGIAIYYSQQLKFDKRIKDIITTRTTSAYVPSVKELLSDKKITTFPNIYHWSFLFCKYIIDTYGWDKMLEILENPKNFYKIMGRTKNMIDVEWDRYLTKKYPDM